jgi:hypothetical protein
MSLVRVQPGEPITTPFLLTVLNPYLAVLPSKFYYSASIVIESVEMATDVTNKGLDNVGQVKP